ncbi:MAG TPA: ribonuclease III [Gammaproteobacteria bacterium]|nr:ribonuclease III [Gammaproteobacteria bacterium]
MIGNLSGLENTLRYRFREPGLLQQALTHRSAGSRNNERLEFLGDAILNMLIAEALFSRYPDLEEGDLSRARASLVNQDALAELAGELQIGNCLTLGPGEMKSGGHRRASILADTLEAIVGALYLDAGFETVRATVRQLFGTRLDKPLLLDELKDAKTRLQEWAQARNRALPVYVVESVSGEPHRQIFRVTCTLDQDGVSASGEASSRRAAEQEAARQVLETVVHEQ